MATFISYIILIKGKSFHHITDSFSPFIAFFIVSYATASFFINIYGNSSYTILLVSLIDEEVEKINFGREEAYNCPASIRHLIN